ncbi:Scd6-like Sm domain-containing protein [Cyathus striatus]|nr:Scd6-like Sm domain-containing protein [Cyathus striatus]
MAYSFIGKPISLISHSDVRYRGILAGIDPAASTIQLSNVYSMGTESRRPPAEFIPPVSEPYSYIIFRASEVKDLSVDENTPRRNVHDDPAVLGASAPVAQAPFAYSAQAPVPQPPQPTPQQGYQPRAQPAAAPVPAAPAQPAPAPTAPATQTAPSQSRPGQTQSSGQKRANSVHTAAASLETVERAIGDLRVSANAPTTHHPHAGRGARRGGRGGRSENTELKVPNTDFDFESMNAKFDKASLAPSKPATEASTPGEAEGEAKQDEGAYNPQKSFFDSLSSSASALPPVGAGAGAGARRGRGGGRNRREEERERNVATFGEPGGVGLMGPGAYVGGWGGYGRRGGRRGRGAPGGGQGRGQAGGQAVQPARG